MRFCLGCHLGFGSIQSFVSFIVSLLGSIYGFFRVSCRGFFSGVLIRISLGFLWASPRVFRVSFRIQTGENEAKENKKNKEAVKTESRDTEEQEAEQQKHMTEEKNKHNSRSRQAQKHKSRKEAGKAEKQNSF